MREEKGIMTKRCQKDACRNFNGHVQFGRVVCDL